MTHVQTSKIPADQTSFRNPCLKSVAHNVDQSVCSIGKARKYQKINSWQYKPICSQIVTTWNTKAFCLLSLLLSSCSLLLVYYQGLFTKEFPPTFKMILSSPPRISTYVCCLSLKSPPNSSQGPPPPFPWSRGPPSIKGDVKQLKQLERDHDDAVELDGRHLPPP